MEFKFRNINDAFRTLVEGIHTGEIYTVAKPSRVGNVLMIPEPVTVCYERPLERVLFNQVRDANPFFHLFESLWMLAGRNDVAPLAFYNSKIADIASDDGETFNGAYGYRWRKSRPKGLPAIGARPVNYLTKDGDSLVGTDQIQILVNHLRENPTSRRAVLQMWEVQDDLMRIDDSCRWEEQVLVNDDPGFEEIPGVDPNVYETRVRSGYSKDVCCNTAAYFSVRDTSQGLAAGSLHPTLKQGTPIGPKVLDMTVTNRSNDLIWGMLGANVVHFAFLQEYLARCLGVVVGKYYQFTNNLHVYENNWKPEEWLAAYENRTAYSPPIAYTDSMRRFVPLVSEQKHFDLEVQRFVDNPHDVWTEPFLSRVARPMCEAFQYHKQREYGKALDCCEVVESDDWRTVGYSWIDRRRKQWEAKRGAVVANEIMWSDWYVGW